MSLRISLIVCALVIPAHFGIASDRTSDHQDGLREHRPDVWALQHATVVVRAGNVVEDATIVVRQGKISSVRPKGKTPQDARVLDMTGKTIYPGLIDGYSETEIPGHQLKQTAGYWNPSVTPHLSVARRLTRNKDASTLREQGVVAQLTAPGNGIIRGQSAVVSTGTDDLNEVVLASDVAQHMQLTLSRRGRDQYPGSPMGAVALARQAMYDAGWYRDAWAAARSDPSLPLPERNVALAALEAPLEGRQPVMVECSSELYVLRADRYANEFGLNLIVRGSGDEYQRLDDIASAKRVIILPVNFPLAPDVSTPELADNASLAELMHWDLAPENPARVHAAGIRFAFTSDQLESASGFLEGVRKSVERGLPEEAALEALTETPAELYGVSHLLGTIEQGKLASFVVTDGDLFSDDSSVVETWVSGKRFEHSSKPHRELSGTYRLKLSGGIKKARVLFVQLKKSGKTTSGRLSDRMFDSELPADEEVEEEDSKKLRGKKKGNSSRENHQPTVVDLQSCQFGDYSATGRFKSDEFSGEGVARISLLFSESGDPKADQLGVGQIVWPSGDVSTVSFARVEESDDEESDDEESDDEESDDEESKAASFAVNYPLGAFGRSSANAEAQTVAFTNATIWTCGPHGVIDRGILIVRNGRILDVGQDIDIPKSIRQVDLKGAHITPGIIDCHSHMASDGGINESTQAITCEVRIGDFIDCTDITIYRQLAGGVTAANILHGSANPIGGQNQVIKLRWGANDDGMKFVEAPQGVKFALGENVKQSNWGDDYRTRYPQTRMGVEQLFRDAFTSAREYGERMDSWKQHKRGLPPRRDLELDALLEMVNGTRWIHCHSYRQDEILALIRVLDEFEITIGTFQHILEGYKVADAMAKHGAMGSAFSDWWAYKFEVYDAIPFGGALMHEAGVVVSFNSDDAELGTRLNLEAAKAVKYGGLDEEEALKFVTLNPAKQLRIDQYVGSLEPGKHADLAIWNGHPLSSFSRCEQTWIDGSRYFDREEDHKARTVVAKMRNTLIQKVLTTGAKMQGDEADGKEDSSRIWPRHDEFCKSSSNDQVRLQRLKSSN